MENQLKCRKKMRLSDFNYKDTSCVFFITICTANKQPCFSDSRIANVVKDEIEIRRMKEEIKLFCYCIMPDHLHLLLSLNDHREKGLQDWVSAFKRYTTRVIRQLFHIMPLWQKNFYDHIVRKDESLLEIVEYILNNPVRKGIVSEWEAYPYSKMIDSLPL